MATQTTSLSTALGKRKATVATYSPLILNLTSSDDVIENSDSTSSSIAKEHKSYKCTYAGCSKVYRKPSRLAEHQRSHTGDRPFVCTICHKSYLRESHLQAHTRSHLPASERPLACDYEDCVKRFWTPQHLRVHLNMHAGEKYFHCPESGCLESFIKHYQLRTHLCIVHAPEGTKPYMCSHTGCSKSFATNQKLTTHLKVHEDKHYACADTACIPVSGHEPVYFPTWTALQRHVRTAHPPTCHFSSCSRRTFTKQAGLRAHLKLHEQYGDDPEQARGDDADHEENATDIDEHPRKRLRRGELGRDWKCQEEDCGKDFTSKKALTTHHNVVHLQRRDFVCTELHCDQAFGYKHLLQRHVARVHADSRSDVGSLDEGKECIASVTGQSYAQRTTKRMAIQCPHPNNPFDIGITNQAPATFTCDYWFTRAYDLRRHLRATHGKEPDKEKIDTWVASVRSSQS